MNKLYNNKLVWIEGLSSLLFSKTSHVDASVAQEMKQQEEQ